jgi:hypothetical protein
MVSPPPEWFMRAGNLLRQHQRYSVAGELPTTSWTKPGSSRVDARREAPKFILLKSAAAEIIFSSDA